MRVFGLRFKRSGIRGVKNLVNYGGGIKGRKTFVIVMFFVIGFAYLVLTRQNSHDEAEQLKREVRVLCWVMTKPKNHTKKADKSPSIHVKNTWGQRCTKLLFFSTEADDELGPIALKYVNEGYKFLWAKTREAFKYVYQHHFEDADWFMKADDDTFVVLENLRYMLKAYDPGHPIQFGSPFKKEVNQTQEYMSGGAGYVLSKEALRRFMEYAYPNETICSQNNSREDVEIGKCLKNVGVEAVDTRDTMGREKLFHFNPDLLATPNIVQPNWYSRRKYYPQSQGMDCCSDKLWKVLRLDPQLEGPISSASYNLF